MVFWKLELFRKGFDDDIMSLTFTLAMIMMALMMTMMIGGDFDDAEDIVFAEVGVHAVGLDKCRRRSEHGVVNHLLHSSHSSKILPGSTIMIMTMIIMMLIIIMIIITIMTLVNHLFFTSY